MNASFAVNQWRQQGTIHLFRAKRWQSQAWHLAEPTTGWANLLELLRLFQAADESCARTLQLSPLQTTNSDYRCVEKWRIEAVKGRNQAEVWDWSGETNAPVLQIGAKYLAEFVACLANSRCEDDGIGLKEKKYESAPSKSELWFWRTMLP
jgi:hypothetical protein